MTEYLKPFKRVGERDNRIAYHLLIIKFCKISLAKLAKKNDK